jgi:hypothetical protein
MKVFLIIGILTLVTFLIFFLMNRKSQHSVFNFEAVKGIFYLVKYVDDGKIVFTENTEIGSALLNKINLELKTITVNPIPFAATSLGTIVLSSKIGDELLIGTIYNMSKKLYEPLIYINNNQYYISNEFVKTINELAQLD